MQDSTANNAEGSAQLDSFRPVEGGNETSGATTFLVAAYAIMWVATVAFVLLTYRRQRALREKVDRLERTLNATEQ